ncbi:MAG: DUF5011 domain-containing protein [Longicatena sp.]
MRKKKKNSLSKKIIAVMLCAFIITVSINPGFTSYVYANSTEIQGVFDQTLSEGDTSAIVDLRIDEVEDKSIESITLPDQTKIQKDNFKRDENNKFLFEYTATENKKLEYVVEYTEKQQNVDNTSLENSPKEPITPEIKKETLTYEVKGIVAPKEKTLVIDAKDITYTVGESIDFRKDITVRNENDIDITESLNFNIVDYGGYSQDKTGDFEIKYDVLHPDTGQVYNFSRLLTVSSKKKTLNNVTPKETASTGYVKLSSSNATLTSPEKFDLTDKTQDSFNVLISYNPNASTSNRKLVLTIPEKFEITKMPSSSELNSADIKKTATGLEITFHEGATISSLFEIVVSRKNAIYNIYKQASLGDYDGVIKIEGFDNTSANAVFNDAFTLHLDELPESNLVIVNNALQINDSIWSGSTSTESRRTLSSLEVIFKPDNKMTKMQEIILKIPKKLGELKLKLGQINVSTTITSDDDYTYIKIDPFAKEEEHILNYFMYGYGNSIGISTSDHVYESYKMTWASNLYRESDKKASIKLGNNEEIDLGKIVVDTRRTETFALQSFEGDIFQIRIDQKNNYLRNNRFLSTKPNYGIESLNATFIFPYELQVISLPSNSTFVKAITNTGREITKIEQMIEGEWIEKVVEKQSVITSESDKGNIRIASGTGFNIREQDSSGNNYPSGKKVDVKVSLSSPDSNIVTNREVVYQRYELLNRDKDELNLKVEENVKDIALSDQKNINVLSMAVFREKDEIQIQVYKNLKMEFVGDKMLSIVDKIGFNYLRNINFNIEVHYKTNLNTEEKVISTNTNQGELKIPLEVGEYLKSLYIVFFEFDIYKLNGGSVWNGDSYFPGSYIYLYSSYIPKYLPLDNSPLDNVSFDSEVVITAENSSKTYSKSGNTPTFKWRTFEDTITASDLSNTKVDGNNFPENYDFGNYALAGFNIKESSKGFVYKNAIFEIEADPLLLSMVRGIRSFRGGTLYYTTNKSNEIKTKKLAAGGNCSPESLNLLNDEYIKSLSIHVDEYDTGGIVYSGGDKIILYTDDTVSIYQSRIDGTYIGDEYKSYPVKMNISADNCESFSKEGKSVSISGKTKTLYSLYSDVSGGEISNPKYYPLSEINNNFSFNSSPFYSKKYPDSSRSVENLILYVELGENFDYVSNSIKIIDRTAKKELEDSDKVIVTLLKKQTLNGHDVLKIDFSNVDSIESNKYYDIPFKTVVKGGTLPKANVTSIYNAYADISSIAPRKQNGLDVEYILNNTLVNDTNRIQDTNTNKLVQIPASYSSGIEILPLNEMGIKDTANSSNGSGVDVIGYETDDFKQNMAIVSNYDKPTKDWIVYIPVPKKGNQIDYLAVEDSITKKKQSDPSQHSLELREFLDVSKFPNNTKISYSTDKTPEYSLDGTNIGNYSSNTSNIKLSDVTMIKVEIPELVAKEKVYFDIDYKAQSKIGLGNQIAYGGVYYNLKLDTSSNYYYNPLGGYGSVVSYTLKDYLVKGYAWEDVEEPINSLYDAADIKKSGVNVYIVDKDGNISDTPDAVTDVDGNFSLAIANHGKKELAFKPKEDVDNELKKTYSFVDANKGDKTISSSVNEKGKTEIILDNKDIFQVNAGLYANRSVVVNPKNVTVTKGQTINVPVSVFPAYSEVTYGKAVDESIATVSNKGVITGVVLGKTKAKVSILNGKGEIVEAEYTITVIPSGSPKVESTPITIFQNGTIDATKDVVITDSDNKPISALDTTKVTINTDNVDVSTPGRYSIIYTVNDGYQTITATRFVYVHGKVQLIVPSDVITKVGTTVTALDGATANYVHINEDGTQTVKTIAVTTPTETITSDHIAKVGVSLEANIVVAGVTDTATGTYQVTFNEKAVLTTVKDNVTVKVGATLEEIKAAINASASITTIDGKTDLTNSIDWNMLNGFDTNVAGAIKTGYISVIDPDTKEVIKKQITVNVSKKVVIDAPTINLIVGDIFDPFANVTITDGDGNAVTLTAEMIKSNNVKVDLEKHTTEVGKYKVVYKYTDLYGNSTTAQTEVYVHGKIKIKVPDTSTVKVNTEIETLKKVSASYKYVKDDGTIIDKEADVSSPLGDITTSNIPTVKTVLIEASDRIGTGLINSGSATYEVIFNGMPSITVTNENVKIRVDATADEIKLKMNALASVQYGDESSATNLTSEIDWSEVDAIDTSKKNKTYTVKLYVTDKDGAKAEKEVSITISDSVNINLPNVDKVIGGTFDPKEGVTIIDGNGKPVNIDDATINDSRVDMSKPGEYEVTYTYTDSLGNTETKVNIVHVHGDLQFEGLERIDLIEGNSMHVVDSAKAFYISSANKKVFVSGSYTDARIDQNIIGKKEVVYNATHPINSVVHTRNQNVYVHGKITINVPATSTVKVNTDIETLKNVSASYKFVNDDGSIIDKDAVVTSPLGNTTTSNVPTVKAIPIEASATVVSGLTNTGNSSYDVIFNGMPEITVANGNIKVKVGATIEEIKAIVNAVANVQYGNETGLTDLTGKIDWTEVEAIDTSVKNSTYEVKLHVTDKDGASAEKTIKIKISDDVIMNLPSVDKVINDTFDPKENVTIFDGEGNPVNMDDVTIDDSKVDMKKPGEYEVTYTYKDSLGNEKTQTNTVRVHGDLQFEGLERIDLIEGKEIYVVDSAKAYYMNSKNKKVYVDGVYDQANIDKEVVGKKEVTFSATHPINKVAESKNQEVYVHGDIVFHKPIDITTGKVKTMLDPSKGVSATYDFVKDDGTIITKNVPITSDEVTSDSVGYKDGKVVGKVEIVKGLNNEKTDSVKVAFNGLPYIEAANTITYTGKIPSIEDVISKMKASAYVKMANGNVINISSDIDYSDVKRVSLDKNGNYQITLTVTDPDGFTTYKIINVIVDIKAEEDPVVPLPPTNTEVPTTPAGSQPPATPQTPAEKDTAAAVSRDIPLSKAKDGITDELVKSYISAFSEKNGNIDFEIISHNVKAKVGEYDVTIRLKDGTELSLKIKVVDDEMIDVDQPEYGRDQDCLIHWFILLLFAGYSAYAIVAMLKRRKDNKDLEKSLGEMGEKKQNVEGVEQDEN